MPPFVVWRRQLQRQSHRWIDVFRRDTFEAPPCLQPLIHGAEARIELCGVGCIDEPNHTQPVGVSTRQRAGRPASCHWPATHG